MKLIARLTRVVTSLVLVASCTSTDVSGCRPETVAVISRLATVDYLDFVAVGDTGSGDSNQQAVADLLVNRTVTEPVSLVLLLGDNFYETGVTSITDPQWLSGFEVMYGSIDLPFFAVLGNHDYLQNPQAQVDYTALSARWNMPDRYYTFSRSLPDQTEIQFFAIDTNTVASEPAQLAWLDGELAASRAEWKIVFGHHTLYSNGFHGSDTALIEALETLFANGGVDLYLSGHDHDLQILTPKKGTHYMVSGAGSRLRSTSCGADTVYSASELGFMSFRISADEIVVCVVHQNAVIDFCRVVRKKPL